MPFRAAVCGGAICMGGGTNPYYYVVAMFHATVCMLVLFMEKGILEQEQFGWDG